MKIFPCGNKVLQLFAIILLMSCTKVGNELKDNSHEFTGDSLEVIGDSLDLNLSCEFLNDTIINDFGSILSNAQDSLYFEIWKSELLNANNIEDSYFDRHYKKINLSSSEWDGGITFRIDYLFTFDWLKFKVSDEFMIKLNSTWSSYQHLGIPRDILLNDEWTRYNIRNEIWHSGICKINKIDKLLNSSCVEACQSFIDSSGYEMIFPQRISIYVPGKIPRVDGYPYFIGYGIIDSVTYSCVKGYFNIVNGEFEVWEDYCGPIH